jgi:PAS domain S-box-containing protein
MYSVMLKSDSIFLILSVLCISLIVVLFILKIKRTKAKTKAKLLLEDQFDEISIQKAEIEAQRDIINKKNQELEHAQQIIKEQNDRLRESNEQLEEMVLARTQELMKTFQKLNFHVDNAPLAITEWNDAMQLTRWSSQAESLFGWKANEVLGMSYHDLPIVNYSATEKSKIGIEEIVQGIVPKNFLKNKNFTKDGREVYVEWSNSVLYSQDGKVESILSIGNDVTAREKAIAELEATNKELDNFIYKASHDLRGPIARMQGLINLGLIEAKDMRTRGYFEMLGRVAGELNSILSKLLVIHSINHHVFDFVEISLKDSIDQIVEEVEHLKKVSNFTVMVNIPQGLVWKCDPFLFKIIIENLIDNAIAYTTNDSSYIIFEAEVVKHNRLKITIKDNGIGVPLAVTHKIFDMFFQGSEKADANTGLNLYMVKKAVEKIDGSIRLVNPANDTIYELLLPEKSM